MNTDRAPHGAGTSMSFDEVITTTRSIRRRFDLDQAVDLALVGECLELALQAPTGSNAQSWHFVVVQDAELRRGLAALYRSGFERYRARPGSVFEAGSQRSDKIATSVEYLADNIGSVPVHVIPCIRGRLGTAADVSAIAPLMASIMPATWSFMLACRSRGLGTCWTTMHLSREREASEMLGIPYEYVTQVGLIPVGHLTSGELRPARRQPLSSVVHVDGW